MGAKAGTRSTRLRARDLRVSDTGSGNWWGDDGPTGYENIHKPGVKTVAHRVDIPMSQPRFHVGARPENMCRREGTRLRGTTHDSRPHTQQGL